MRTRHEMTPRATGRAERLAVRSAEGVRLIDGERRAGETLDKPLKDEHLAWLEECKIKRLFEEYVYEEVPERGMGA